MKRNYEEFMIIDWILMFSWFSFLMQKQSNNLCGNGQGRQMEFYMM